MFCPKCGNMLMPKGGKMVCATHGPVEGSGKITDKTTTKLKNIKAAAEDIEVHAKTREKCPKCGNESAYYWTVQTRSIDEAPTKFFKCTKCQHQWREYG